MLLFVIHCPFFAHFTRFRQNIKLIKKIINVAGMVSTKRSTCKYSNFCAAFFKAVIIMLRNTHLFALFHLSKNAC